MARFALIVGIAQYGAKGLAQLEKTTTDAEAVAQVLEQYGNFTEVKRLPSRINSETKKRAMVNQPVTANELWQAIETLLNEQARNNEALIYFTGHGLKAEGRSGKPRGYLATSDCQIKADVIKSEGNKDEPRITEVQGGVAFDDLNDLISKSELSSLVILLDCCHSGNFIESNLIKHSFGISLEKDYYLIAACRGFQTGKALKSEAHSVFTGALLRGLRAENASSDGEISCDRLYDYISRELRGSSQQPLKLGWGTSIVLVNNPLIIAPPVDEVPAAQAAVNTDNPYLGLMAFDADKKDYFFGRKAAVRGIGERLSKSGFLAVIGPSGCGKSSLVKAGVLPELKRDLIPDSSQWEVKIFTPGRYPLEELEQALASRESGKTFLLFIDQFEELFTLGSDESQQREFISKITEEATKIDGDTRVIVAIRGDFLDRCARYQETANLINCTQPTTYVVTPMTTAELTEAIEQPAEKHAIAFESGLVEQIIIDVVNQAGALPLLQYALAELWRVGVIDSNQLEPQLTFKGYEQIRGVKGALEKRADELYQDLAEADQKFVRCLFLELVQLGENQEVTRRRASWQDLLDKADSQEQLERVTRQLASWNQRLIITDENKVEVAHEALLSEWRRLREWIEDNRDNIRLERRLKGDCQEWNKQNWPEGLLLTGTWLEAIDGWVNKEQPRLSLLESKFLRESLGRRDRQIQDERKILEREIQLRDEKLKVQKQRTKWAIASGILITFTLALGLLANVLEGQKRERESMAIATLVSTSEVLLKANNQLEALRTSIEALKKLREIRNSDTITLSKLQTVIYSVQERNRLEGHQDAVTSISFSPNAGILASASADQNIKLWNLEGQILRSFPGASGSNNLIHEIKFNPQEKTIASASNDRAIIWSINGEKLHTFSSFQGSVFSVSFSDDGSWLAVSDAGGNIKIWTTQIFQKVNDLTDNRFTNKIYKVAYIYTTDFNPKNKHQIAYAGFLDGGKVKIWNLKTNATQTLGEHKGMVNSVKFSPSGSILISAGRDGNIKLWSLKRGKFIGEIHANQGELYGLAVSEDEKLIASGGSDTTIKLWSVDEVTKMGNNKKPLERPTETVKGHKGQVNSVQFLEQTKDGRITLASSSDDKSVRIWQLDISSTKNKIQEQRKLNDLLQDACKIIEPYLKSSQKLTSEEKKVCDS